MTKTFIHHSVLTIGSVAVMAALFSYSALLARAESSPVITTTVHTVSHATVTTAVPGTQFHANTIVASTTVSVIPTGTVDFNRYSNLTCSGAPAVQSGITLVNGVAESGTTTLTASGLSYLVHYNGDATTTAATSTCATIATSTPVVVPGTISGNVYNDLNTNKVKDGTDVGIAGFVVNLHKGATNGAAIVASATTDVNGNYSFGSLALATYYVEEINKAGWTQTTLDSAVTLTAGATTGTVNFANVAASTTVKSDDHGKKEGWFKHFFKKFTKFQNNHDNGKRNGNDD